MENLNIQQNTGGNTVNQPNNQAYPPPLSPEVAEEKRFKKWLYKVLGGNLLYNGVMLIGSIAALFAYIIIILVVEVIKNGEVFTGKKPVDITTDIMKTIMNKTDMGMIFAVLIAFLVLFLFMRKILKFKDIFVKRKTMTPKSFFSIFAVFLGGQFAFNVINICLEKLLNLIGYSCEAAAELASGDNNSILMMFYIGFIAPVFEEIVLRGYLMQPLEKTGIGKGYAVLVSSIVFGIMHGNILQSPFAALVGMALGYAAIEYGVKWAILIHFLNNFVINYGMGLIISAVPENMVGYIDTGFFVVCGLLAACVLIARRKDISTYIKENYKTPKKYYKWTFTNPLFLVLLGFYTLTSLMLITKI